MDDPPRRTNNFSNGHFRHKVSGQGGHTNLKYRLLLLGLGLLNVVLLISAAVIGINCSKIKQGSLHIQHPAAVQLLTELHDLFNNHSDMFMAEEDANRALEATVKNHAMLQDQLNQKKIINDDYLKQLEDLRTERTTLSNNISSLESSCGKCPPRFIYLNSSCYFFSYSESSTVKKNWYNSRADCVNRGSDLVVIDSPEEQAFVSNSLRKIITGPTSWETGSWVGLTDMDKEGDWVWINNVTEVETRYWEDGEPNNRGSGGEDCASTHYSPSNPWKTRNDVNCRKHKLYWICEKVAR